MMSRSSILPSASASRQATSARTVSGFSQMPPIIISRPASIRLAIAISPSRDNSSTEPISRRYMRTGSSVRPTSSSSTLPRVSPSPSSRSTAPDSSLSSLPLRLMPSSESIDQRDAGNAEDRQHQGGNPGAAAEIDKAFGPFRNKWQQLRRIEDVTAPRIGQRGAADQVEALRPALQQIEIGRQPRQRLPRNADAFGKFFGAERRARLRLRARPAPAAA